MINFILKSIILVLFLTGCKYNTDNIGKELELLRIQTLKNSDAYENIVEFDHLIDSWNTTDGKLKADSFFLKLAEDYHLKLTEQKGIQTFEILRENKVYLEINNPLINGQKIEIPVINFYNKNQDIEVNSTLIYFKRFHLEDFKKKRKQIMGKTLVLELKETEFKKFIENSKLSGILGLIIIVEEGNQVPCYQFEGTHRIPILGLSQDDGFFLIESLKKYPKQFVKILVKQKVEKKSLKIWKWEKNFHQLRNLYVISSWKSKLCSKAILSHVTPSFILLDLAKTFQNYEWKSGYNLIFIWTESKDFHLGVGSNDICVNIDHLTDFLGWNYPQKLKKNWDFALKYLKIYESDLLIKTHHQRFAYPIISEEIKRVMNTDSENTEWIHKNMILRSQGMLALSLYLLSLN